MHLIDSTWEEVIPPQSGSREGLAGGEDPEVRTLPLARLHLLISHLGSAHPGTNC